MKKKKTIIIVVSVIAIIAVAAGFFSYPLLFSKDIQQIMNVNFESIDKVVVGSGTTGKTYSIEGKENLQDFFHLFKNAKLTKSLDQNKNDGFIYSAVLYESGKEVVGFNFGYNLITISKDHQYTRYTSDNNIDENQIKEIAQKYKLNS